MAAVRESEQVARRYRRRRRARGHAVRQVGGIARRRGDFEQVDAALAAADREPAARRTATSSGSACSRWAAIARPLAITICAAWCSAAPPMCIERAPPWPLPLLHRPRIGLDVAERGDRQPEQIGGDLRIARLVALAVRLRAEHQRDLAVRLEADLGALARRAARGFEKTGDRRARAAGRAPPPPAAARQSRRPRSAAAISSRLAAKRPQSIVTPSPLRYGKSADQVAPAQLDRVEPQTAARRGRPAARSGSWPRACRRRDRRRSARCW